MRTDPTRPVLLASGQPLRWQGRRQFTIVEIAAEAGPLFLAAWRAWRRDPGRSQRLSFVSLAGPASAPTALASVDDGDGSAARLVSAWPPATPDLHRLSFDDGRVELLLAFGDAAAWLRELELSADAFFLDRSSDGSTTDRWDARFCKALARLAAPDAALAARTATPSLGAHLRSAGFELRAAGGDDPELTLACFRPVHTSRPSARRTVSASTEDRALIVGGGLAGAAAAAALAERGWHSALYEAGPTLATGASGNPAGLFHGTVHADDGVHARFARAAALAVAPLVTRAIAEHGAAGAVCGFLRLEPRLALASMQALLVRSGLPPAYVEAVDADVASALAGLRLPCPAWHYPRGGWVDPAGLVAAGVARAGERLRVRTGVRVASIRSVGGRWQLFDDDGSAIDEAATLVLANAADALRLLGDPGWPVERVRGQLSFSARGSMPAVLAGCRLPVAGNGYVVPTPAGLVFGATRQRDDGDASLRRADHAWNLARLEALVGAPLGIDIATLTGRTAWRFATHDRLPLIGAVPALAIVRGERANEPRWNQPRHVPREPGLFVFTALGSRGISVSALGAQVLAADIAGTPVPLASRLIDAIDPARFVSRSARLGAAAD